MNFFIFVCLLYINFLPVHGLPKEFLCSRIFGCDECQAQDCFWHGDGICRVECFEESGCLKESCRVCRASIGNWGSPIEGCNRPCPVYSYGCFPDCSCMFSTIQKFDVMMGMCITTPTAMLAIKISKLYVDGKASTNAQTLFMPQYSKRATSTSMNPKDIVGKIVGTVAIALGQPIDTPAVKLPSLIRLYDWQVDLAKRELFPVFHEALCMQMNDGIYEYYSNMMRTDQFLEDVVLTSDVRYGEAFQGNDDAPKVEGVPEDIHDRIKQRLIPNFHNLAVAQGEVRCAPNLDTYVLGTHQEDQTLFMKRQIEICANEISWIKCENLSLCKWLGGMCKKKSGGGEEEEGKGEDGKEDKGEGDNEGEDGKEGNKEKEKKEEKKDKDKKEDEGEDKGKEDDGKDEGEGKEGEEGEEGEGSTPTDVGGQIDDVACFQYNKKKDCEFRGDVCEWKTSTFENAVIPKCGVEGAKCCPHCPCLHFGYKCFEGFCQECQTGFDCPEFYICKDVPNPLNEVSSIPEYEKAHMIGRCIKDPSDKNQGIGPALELYKKCIEMTDISVLYMIANLFEYFDDSTAHQEPSQEDMAQSRDDPTTHDASRQEKEANKGKTSKDKLLPMLKIAGGILLAGLVIRGIQLFFCVFPGAWEAFFGAPVFNVLFRVFENMVIFKISGSCDTGSRVDTTNYLKEKFDFMESDVLAGAVNIIYDFINIIGNVVTRENGTTTIKTFQSQNRTVNIKKNPEDDAFFDPSHFNQEELEFLKEKFDSN